MAREKEGFRLNLERINEAFPGKELLIATEIARFEGRDVRTVRKRYKFNQFGEMTKADWARQASV